jgi:hypothetical protein
MIDPHLGHLTVDSNQRVVSLLDGLALERAVDAGVDAGAGTRQAVRRHGFQASRKRASADGGRAVDTQATPVAIGAIRSGGLVSRNFAKPSDGLEPSTPSFTMEDSRCDCRAPESRSQRRFPCTLSSSGAKHHLPRRPLSGLQNPRTCPQNPSPTAARSRRWSRPSRSA